VRNLSPAQRPLILTVHDGDRVIGLAPLVEKRIKIRSLPVRQIAFLTNPLTPFVDFLLLDAEAGLTTIIQYLLQRRTNWGVLSFGKFKEDSAHLPLLTCLLTKSGCHICNREVGRVPFLPLDSKWEEFYQSKSRKFRMTRRSVANRLRRLGPITVERVRSEADAKDGLEAMLSVSARGWKRGAGKDLLTLEFERSFLSDLTQTASRQGWLSVWLLKHENNVLAAEYHLNDHGTMYGLRAQYDEAYAAYSPGRYLDYEIVEQLFRDGCTCYDMGPGAADYKLAWTDRTYACRTIDVYGPLLYPQFVHRLQHVWIPALKQTKLGRWMAKRADALQKLD
jgi:hypothetical protein